MKLLVKVALGIWVFVLSYFVYIGMVTTAWEGDSLAYHIPIAERIISGDFLKKETFDSNFYYYPATGEMLLTILMRLGIPMNLYGVVGWVWLTTAVYKLARKTGLTHAWSSLLAFGIALLTSTVRLIPTQTVDLFVAAALLESVRLVLEPNKSLVYWAKLGAMMGLLLGLKFSGVFYAGLILLIWGRSLWKDISIKSFGVWATLVILCGGFWYLRNWVFTGQFMPLPYPTTPTGWVTKPLEELPITWLTVKNTPGGLNIFIEGMWSEFLLGGILAFMAWLIRDRIYLLGFVVFWLYLWMPAAAGNILSDFRYVIGGVALMAISLAGNMKTNKLKETIAMVLVLNMVMVLPQLEYRPKIVLVSFLLVMGYEMWMMRKWQRV